MKKIKSPVVVVLDGPGSSVDQLLKLQERHAPFMTIKEICGILKVSRQTVIRWIRAKKLRAFKPGRGRAWRVRRADFDEFIEGKHGRL